MAYLCFLLSGAVTKNHAKCLCKGVFMRLFLFIAAVPFLASLAFGWGAFPIVCGLYFIAGFSAAILRVFGVDLLGGLFCWGYVPPSGFSSLPNLSSSSNRTEITNPATGLTMAGGVDVGGNPYGSRRDY